MGNYLKKSRKLIILLAGLWLGQISYAVVENMPESAHAVPKGLQDIVKLINETGADVKNRDADLKLLSSSPPEGATKEEKFSFYYLQGQAAERLGRVDARVVALQKALENAKERDVQELVALSELAIAESQAGNINSALDHLLKGIAKIPPHLLGFALAYNGGLASTYASAGDFSNAEKNLKEVAGILVLLKRSPAYSIYGFNWTNNYYRAVGITAYQQGKFDQADIAFRKAIDSLEPGIPQYEKNYAASGVPGSDNNSTGHPNTFKAGLEYLYGIESDTLLKLRKVNEAEYFAREALKKSLKRTGKSSVATSAAMRQLAIVMLARERNKDAIYLLNQSLIGLKEAGVSAQSLSLARTQKTLASALIADGRYADALKNYAELDKTTQAYPEMARFVDTNSQDRVLALAHTGALAEAETRARQVIGHAEARTGKKSKETTQARLMLAMVLAEQKKDEEAKALYASGMADLIEQEREASADSEVSTKEKKHLASIIESYLSLLSRAYEKTPVPAIAAQAFELGDMVRSSGVQKALNASTARANISNPRLAELARKEQDVNQQITFLSRFSKELAMQPASQQLPQIQAKMKADIEALRLEAKKTLHLIELDFPEYAELISPKPVSLDKIQKILKPQEVLVTWFVGKQKSYVWAVSHGGVTQFKALAINQEAVKKTITQLRKALDPQVLSIEEIPVFDFALSHQLYESLFKPVQSALDGKSTVVVIPHDEIGQLPLGVLTTAPFTPGEKANLLFANYRAAPWLIKKHAIVSVPSATAMNALRGLPKPKEGRYDFIGFGDPIFSQEQAKADEKTASAPAVTQLASRGVPLKLRNSPNTSQVSSAEVSILPRLPDTNEEIREISKVFSVDPNRDIYLQKRASLEEIMKADLYNRKVVMFSTHGLVPGELDGLTQPALALTNPAVLNKPGDGLLKVDQILLLKLNADWVVLSACNTAAGEGDGAEALSGLGRAFFYAGARSLLVSSWPVDSQASRKLMTDLFKRQTQDKTLSKPQALQLASVTLMDKGMPDEAGAAYSYAHPLFWAPFTMVGD